MDITLDLNRFSFICIFIHNFINFVLSSFDRRRVEPTGGWRKVLNDELYNRYSPRNIIETNKRRMML
jgi:hypothetical protein